MKKGDLKMKKGDLKMKKAILKEWKNHKNNYGKTGEWFECIDVDSCGEEANKND